MSIKLKSISTTLLSDNNAFYRNNNLKYNVYLYTDTYLVNNYKIAIISYVDKHLNTQIGYTRLRTLGQYSKISIIDINNGKEVSLLNSIGVDSYFTATMGAFPLGKLKEDLDSIENTYSNIINKLINTAQADIPKIDRHIKIEEKKKEIKKNEEIEIINNNEVIITYGNAGVYILKFWPDYILITKSDSKSFINQHALGIDENKKLIELLDKYLELYGFKFSDNIEIILDDLGMLNKTSFILKMILMLTDKLEVKKGFRHGRNSSAISSMHLPAKIDLNRLSKELFKITNGEETCCMLPNKLHRFPYLRDVNYLSDRIYAVSSGDGIRVDIPLYLSKINLDNLRNTIRKDINNIVKECYRSIKVGQLNPSGEIAPINMYKVSHYKIVGSNLIIYFKLKIDAEDIEINVLDTLTNPKDKR